MNDTLPKILISGVTTDVEVAAHLHEVMAVASKQSWAELMSGVKSDTASSNPDLAELDLIVIVQIRRGEFPQADIDLLNLAFPMTAKVVVYGPWCEGETRSGRPVADVLRIAVSRWPMAFDKFLFEFQEHGTSQWHQPPVVSDLQRVLDPPWPETNQLKFADDGKPMLLVSSRERTAAESLSNFAMDAGWQTVPLDETSPSQSADVLVVDCYFSIDEAIQAAKMLDHPLPVVALLGFARQSDREQLAAVAPHSMVLGKPFSNDDLRQAILRVTRRHSNDVEGSKASAIT